MKLFFLGCVGKRIGDVEMETLNDKRNCSVIDVYSTEVLSSLETWYFGRLPF